MKRDPKIPKTGKCAVCGKARPAVAKEKKHSDPFCSSICARVHHKVHFLSDDSAQGAHPLKRDRPDLDVKREREATPEYKAKKAERNARRKKTMMTGTA